MTTILERIMKKNRTLSWILLFCTIIGQTWTNPSRPAYAAKAQKDWIDAYISFIENKEFLQQGQVYIENPYSNEYLVSGLFFDMDHDGIPEIILDNGDGTTGYVYSYVNGTVAYIGEGPSHGTWVKVTGDGLGYDGDIYGTKYTKTNKTLLIQYIKKANAIVTKEVLSGNDIYYRIGDDYYSVQNWRFSSKELVQDLLMMRELSGIYSNPVQCIAEIETILWLLSRGIDYQSPQYYDCHNNDLSAEWLLCILHLSEWYGADVNYHYYFSDIVKYDGKLSDRYSSQFSQVLGKDCLVLDGKKLEWIFENVFNRDSEFISMIRSIQDKNTYYKDGNYYFKYQDEEIGRQCMGLRFCDIEPRDGGYLFKYNVIYSSGGDGLWEEECYALADYKNMGGKKHWSVYCTNNKPIDDFTIDDDIIQSEDIFDKKYSPYPIVALQSTNVNKGAYVTCDIGTKKDGKYEYFDEPDLHLDAKEVGAYEMFELIPCTDGCYALRSIMNRQFLTKDLEGYSYVHADFLTDSCKLELDLSADDTRIKFCESGEYLIYSKGILKPGRKASAVRFKIITVTDNKYSSWEKNILSSGEWFNIDGKGVGYWDIQYEIGVGSTRALRKLGYTTMHLPNSNENTIENGNMQCSVGVKLDDGIYDVVIAFQGTGGFSGSRVELWDLFIDGMHSLINNPFHNVMVHSGYYIMAEKFETKEKEIIANVAGKDITIEQLINMAKTGEARFTLLGHSMGGAIAQIYSLMLLNKQVPPDMIKGRTFNSALAVTCDDDGKWFRDWINLCVSSDSVTNGLVVMSLDYYGIHRLGKSIWLYDDTPDQDIDKLSFNISEPKHNMDQKLQEILRVYASNGLIEGFAPIDPESLYVVNRDAAPVYAEQRKESDKQTSLDRYKVLDVVGSTYNEYGNKWYILRDGSYIYSANVSQIVKLQIDNTKKFVCYGAEVPVREGFNKDTKVVGYIFMNQVVTPKYAVKNSAGNVWLYIGTGWVYVENLGIIDSMGLRRIQIDCPVDVELFDADNKLIAAIAHDGQMVSNDVEKVAPFTIGNIKYFDISSEEKYIVKINGVAVGTMDYTVYENYDEEKGEFLTKKLFETVELEENKKFESFISDGPGGIKLNVMNDDGEVVSEIAGTVRGEEYVSRKVGSEESSWKLIVCIICGFAVLLVIVIIFFVKRARHRKNLLMAPKMSAGQQVNLAMTHFCTNCGKTFEKNQNFCTRCGNKRQ